MKTLEGIIKILEKQKDLLKQQYGVKEIGIFGSYVKIQKKKKSDLDILVEFDKSIGLLKFVNLQNYLSKISGVKVDLIIKDVLKPRIGKHILKKVIYIWKENMVIT